MYEGVVLLGCVGVAAGLGAGTYWLTKRRASGWSKTINVKGAGIFRGGGQGEGEEGGTQAIVVETTEPVLVRVSAGASVLAAGIGLIRGGLAAFDDLPNLVDGPHREIHMVPDSPLLAILTVLYALVSLGTIPLFVYAAWKSRTPQGVRRAWGALGAIIALPFALTDAWMINATCRAIYWVDRMVLLSLFHAFVLFIALVLSLIAALRVPRGPDDDIDAPAGDPARS